MSEQENHDNKQHLLQIYLKSKWIKVILVVKISTRTYILSASKIITSCCYVRHLESFKKIMKNQK